MISKYKIIILKDNQIMLYSRGKLIYTILFSTSTYQNINVLKHFNDSFYFYILMLFRDNIVYLKQSYIYK